MSEEHLLGEKSRKSMVYQREVRYALEIRISRSNDPSLSESERTVFKEWVERWSAVRVMDILQCRHFSTYDLEYPFLFQFGLQQSNCKTPLAVYKEVPASGHEGFTLPSDDNALLHIIAFLDYFTAHKMTLVSKRFKGIMHTFKNMRSNEMLASMPFILDDMETARFDPPELTFRKSWHSKYEEDHRAILCDDAMDFANRKDFFDFDDGSDTLHERLSVALRTHYARQCMDIYESFPLSAIEDMIMENPLHRNGYISLDKPQVSEHSGFECHPYIRFKILSRHQVSLQQAWTIFVERIIVNSDEYWQSKRNVPRRYLLWSLLAAADPSSIHLSHVHAGCDSRWSINVYDHIALSFIVGGERVEVVGRIEQFGDY
ncbi:predicted protein [Chaetoceros tenuissimus]|uniref:F-box domain-containing protein n=1 Tax=Chaetoceros tenuissimus TaxID=426638 RepID=A0AAD3H4S1_9STRA|nr:predicted protein [Chaetoceros tenuissimus]